MNDNKTPSDQYQTTGVKNGLPVFYEKLKERIDYPYAYDPEKFPDFDKWKKIARNKVLDCMLPPPPFFDLDPVILEEEDRGSYTARKIIINITADSRVLSYMLVPKGAGPFPAVLLLHDHGARFDIGKEKVIKPFNIEAKKIESSEQWITEYYGGRYIGDELAKRGYVCFATDMLNWSDRGGAGFDGQQALAANLYMLGTSFAGIIAHEDMNAVKFLLSFDYIIPGKIAAMGLSVGSYRTWQLTAISPDICCGVAVCLMASLKGLMVPFNNMTLGTSAYTMIHPGLHALMDYPDIASLACPKPLMIYNGLQDGLFPIPCVEDAFDKMRRVWASQGAENKLITKLWDVAHVFSYEMQEEAFNWLASNI